MNAYIYIHKYLLYENIYICVCVWVCGCLWVCVCVCALTVGSSQDQSRDEGDEGNSQSVSNKYLQSVYILLPNRRLTTNKQTNIKDKKRSIQRVKNNPKQQKDTINTRKKIKLEERTPLKTLTKNNQTNQNKIKKQIN